MIKKLFFLSVLNFLLVGCNTENVQTKRNTNLIESESEAVIMESDSIIEDESQSIVESGTRPFVLTEKLTDSEVYQLLSGYWESEDGYVKTHRPNGTILNGRHWGEPPSPENLLAKYFNYNYYYTVTEQDTQHSLFYLRYVDKNDSNNYLDKEVTISQDGNVMIEKFINDKNDYVEFTFTKVSEYEDILNTLQNLTGEAIPNQITDHNVSLKYRFVMHRLRNNDLAKDMIKEVWYDDNLQAIVISVTDGMKEVFDAASETNPDPMMVAGWAATMFNVLMIKDELLNSRLLDDSFSIYYIYDDSSTITNLIHMKASTITDYTKD